VTTDQVDELFAVLADPTRRRVVQLLGEQPWRAGELARAADVSAPVVSRHLRILLAAGVVADERVAGDARLRVFRLRHESLVALQAWLDQVQAHWTQQLGSFKRHVEGNTRHAEEGRRHVEGNTRHVEGDRRRVEGEERR
jgi:DNA-binding transcriptional ArsR family regulator